MLRSLGGRECGKALTLPLKLVMETWLQRAANGLSLTANQSEETHFLPWWPGGAWAMVGRPAADGAHGCPWRSVKTPLCRRAALNVRRTKHESGETQGCGAETGGRECSSDSRQVRRSPYWSPVLFQASGRTGLCTAVQAEGSGIFLPTTKGRLLAMKLWRQNTAQALSAEAPTRQRTNKKDTDK